MGDTNFISRGAGWVAVFRFTVANKVCTVRSKLIKLNWPGPELRNLLHIGFPIEFMDACYTQIEANPIVGLNLEDVILHGTWDTCGRFWEIIVKTSILQNERPAF